MHELERAAYEYSRRTRRTAGLGFEAARQLALQDDTKKVILACRNSDRAKAAQESLEELTGKTVFETLLIDVGDLESCRKAAEALSEPVDGIILVRATVACFKVAAPPMDFAY